MARYLLLTITLTLSSLVLFSQASLSGTVTDEETGEPIILGNVALYKNGNLTGGGETDFDGNYSIGNLDPGTYDVEVSYVGYANNRISGVVVNAGKAVKLDIKLNRGINLIEVVVTEYKVPLIEQDNTTSGATITAEQIRQLPTRNINALAATSAGVSSNDEGGDINMKGSRSNATFYYVDDIRVFGNLPPESEIEQLQTVTGGIEAKYGDVTGGFINITTKGPSSDFTGSIEGETSEYLDPYKNSLVGFSLSGPILKKKTPDPVTKKRESLLGFRISGRYTYQLDDDPPAIPVYRIKDEKLKELEANPVINFLGGKTLAGEFLKDEDVNALDANPYEDDRRVDITAKLDARLSKAIDLTLSTNYSYQKDRFTPNNWRLLNSHNNPYNIDNDIRYNVRFRHRLGKTGASTADDGSQRVSPVQNVYYVLQAGYENNRTAVEDLNHGDNYFNYGYIGNWDYTWEPSFSQVTPANPVPTHVDFARIYRGYTPGTINPVLAAYNNSSDDTNDDDLVAQNGFISNLFDAPYGFHTNVGQVYNLSRKIDDDIITFNVSGGLDLVTGKNGTSRHSIQFGIMHEERTQRRYDVRPFSLWQLGRQLANRHILGVDTASVVDMDTISVGGQDVLIPIYGKKLDLETYSDSRFFSRVREVTNQGLDEYVNVDELSPEQMNLGMFSAQELNDQYVLTYFGYDYQGNEFNGDFLDFFSATDATGLRTFPVAPFRPIYQAAYIQDKFQLKDIIFRVGLRVDRFDANTKVMKDPYSLYEIMGAKDFHALSDITAERPGNIGDDFKVYVTSQDGREVKAYREGDQWYTPTGTPVNDGNLIFESGGLVYPKFKDEGPRQGYSYIKNENFDPNVSFKDYEVQVNWMPRLAFSFPISDEANFFAHYDILVQRPASNFLVTPRNYFYYFENFEQGRDNAPKNNANLLPERTVDYEVGFQQKLSNTSALKIAAFYKELRNMIQRRTFLYVAGLNNYETYDNIDFGTVKGFTFQYDLRRTGNISAQVAYTLQFADGTGSDENSQRGLTSRGILRTLFPLSYDERHRVVANFDYRYQSGKKYNGPRLFGADIFSDAGVNLQAIAVSGRPYTQKLVPARFGGDGTVGAINGSRLPWNFTLNLRVDKNFNLSKPGSRPLDLNVYLRVSNLLDRKNWLNVYAATGSPSDDGFIQSSRGADTIEDLERSNRDVELYLNSYQWRMLNPDYYTLPRRIFIGAIFGF